MLAIAEHELSLDALAIEPGRFGVDTPGTRLSGAMCRPDPARTISQNAPSE
jgi:hypothetical protein